MSVRPWPSGTPSGTELRPWSQHKYHLDTGSWGGNIYLITLWPLKPWYQHNNLPVEAMNQHKNHFEAPESAQLGPLQKLFLWFHSVPFLGHLICNNFCLSSGVSLYLPILNDLPVKLWELPFSCIKYLIFSTSKIIPSVYLCVCMCVCLCVWVCLYVCLCVCLCVSVCLCSQVNTKHLPKKTKTTSKEAPLKDWKIDFCLLAVKEQCKIPSGLFFLCSSFLCSFLNVFVK